MPIGKSTKRKRRGRRPVPEVRAKAEQMEELLKTSPAILSPEPLPIAEAPSEPVATAPAEKVDSQPAKLPQYLLDRMEAASKVVEDVQTEIARFKAHPDFQEGSMPGTLYGLRGDPNILGSRSLNFVDPKHIYADTHIHWANRRMVDHHRGQGYEPFDKDKFDTMVASYGGAYSYGHNAENHVTIGDLVLMRTSRDHYKARDAAKHERTQSREKRAKNTLYNQGEKLGVEVWEKDYAGPKLSRIMAMLTKEFGHEELKHLLLDH